MQRKKLSEKQASLLAYKQNAPLSIGRTRAEQAEYETAEEAAVITEVRKAIWLVRSSCQLCHGHRANECNGVADQMHEDPPRSATRGQPPWLRFNFFVCARLCAACHRDVTENRIRIEFADPVRRFAGRITAVTV